MANRDGVLPALRGCQPKLLSTSGSPASEPPRSRGASGFQLGTHHEEQQGSSLEGAARADDLSAGSEAVGNVGRGESREGEAGSSHLDRGARAAGDSRLRAEAFSPIALTDGERRAFRMGALAAGAIYIDAVGTTRCACRSRVENLRIAIAAHGVECEAPEFWPQRGGP